MHYAALQKDAHERRRIQLENAARRATGLKEPPVPKDLLRKSKSRRKSAKVPVHRGEDERRQRSYLEGSGDSDTWVTKVGKRGRRSQGRLNEESFQYEGRESLPNNL